MAKERGRIIAVVGWAAGLASLYLFLLRPLQRDLADARAEIRALRATVARDEAAVQSLGGIVNHNAVLTEQTATTVRGMATTRPAGGQ